MTRDTVHPIRGNPKQKHVTEASISADTMHNSNSISDNSNPIVSIWNNKSLYAAATAIGFVFALVWEVGGWLWRSPYVDKPARESQIEALRQSQDVIKDAVGRTEHGSKERDAEAGQRLERLTGAVGDLAKGAAATDASVRALSGQVEVLGRRVDALPDRILQRQGGADGSHRQREAAQK